MPAFPRANSINDSKPIQSTHPYSISSAMTSAEKIPKTDTGADLSRDRFAELPGLATVFAQVVLIALVMRNSGIETLGFHRVIYIAACGFVVNHLLPLRHRLPFFFALSIVAMVVALGGSAGAKMPHLALGISRAGLIFGIGVVLIVICHLPISFGKRGILLIIVGAVAAEFRSGTWNSMVFAVVWPVLAAMFMFRVIIYLYEVSNSTHRPSKVQSLTYFFLIPNCCALLFPVIDFRTFCQKYYDEEALIIYQRGVKWMTRGIIQLLIYRLTYQVFALEASDVADGTDLIQFVVANIFLYLKVSGSFHLFIGMLLLFGFNLPETNHRYFLASSFTDYWRRVNTYWRAFMMKVFFYPAFFRFKNRGQVIALIIATLWCFFVTWSLHIYQTWWIKGAVSWVWTDALFWTALALLVLANSLWELKNNKRQKMIKGVATRSEAIAVILRTAFTFVVITVLWSLWNTPTLKLWFHIWSLADLQTLAWGAGVVACVMIAAALFEVSLAAKTRPVGRSIAIGFSGKVSIRSEALICAGSLLAILLLTSIPDQQRLAHQETQYLSMTADLARIVMGEEALENGHGYYENLTAVDASTVQFWETMTTNNSLVLLNQLIFINDANARELAPNIHIEENGLRMDTNRWGMRDRDLPLMKPPATLRLAFLGSSHVMGYGLPTKDMFETVLEDRLNRENHRDGGFQLLNFSVSGESPMGQIWMLHNRVAAFHPDIVFFVAHLIDFDWVNRDVVQIIRKHESLPSGFPAHVLAQANIRSRTSEPFAMKSLRPQESEILLYCYREMVRECRSINALPVCIFLPVPTDFPLDRKSVTNLLNISNNAGFITIDLSSIFADYNPKDLMLNERWLHSNARAHAIIAEALYDQITTDPRIDLLDRARQVSASLPAEPLAN
jgi:hypothetical protein